MFGNFLHHFVASRVIMLNSVERFRENWTKLMVFCFCFLSEDVWFWHSRTGSFKQLSLQKRRDQFRRQSKALVLENLDAWHYCPKIARTWRSWASRFFSVAGKRWYSQVAYNHRIGSIWNRFTRSLQGFVQPTTIFLNQRKHWQSGNVRHVILKISVKTSEMCSLEVPCVLKCSEDGTVSQSCGTSSLSALDLLSSTLPDPESSRHHY